MNFIAFDGEGYTENGVHNYFLLANSEGQYVSTSKGSLGFFDCIDFMFETLKEGAVGISFYFSYDVTMMLKELPFMLQKELQKNGTVDITYHRRPGIKYRIEYIPRKIFTVTEYRITKGEPRKRLRKFTIYDVWGFFQGSFVKALRSFGFKDEADRIEVMKDERSVFTLDRAKEILDYCVSECQLLVSLFNLMYHAISSAGFNISSYHGPGAVANVVFKEHKSHVILNREYDAHGTYVHQAYFGGRIQAILLGKHEKAYSYDIVSAYPDALRTLPELGSNPESVNKYVPGVPGLYKVRWHSWDFGHLPVRLENGGIVYPLCGVGVYWHYEIEHLLDRLEIVHGMIYPEATGLPFAFVEELFLRRKALKDMKDPAQIGVKLALNSLYGKTAQQVGYRGKPSRFSDMITSYTRAKIAKAILGYEEDIISISTDGILSRVPLPHLPISSALGDWDYSEVSDLFIFGSGNYHGYYKEDESPKNPSGEKSRTRGFRRLPWEELRAKWDSNGIHTKGSVTSQKFYSLGSANAHEQVGTWCEEVRKITAYPSNKRTPEYLGDGLYRIHEPVRAPESCPYKSPLEDKPAITVFDIDITEDFTDCKTILY